jgi:hypothetical protein
MPETSGAVNSLITNSMVLSYSQKAGSYSAGEDIINFNRTQRFITMSTKICH